MWRCGLCVCASAASFVIENRGLQTSLLCTPFDHLLLNSKSVPQDPEMGRYMGYTEDEVVSQVSLFLHNHYISYNSSLP